MSKLSGELAKMDEKNILNRIEKLEKTLKGLQNQTASINALDDLTDNLGDQRAGNFLATNDESGYPDGENYTGCFMSADGYTIGSVNYHIGGMNNGTLQWGAKNSDGGFVAGSGAVEMGASGININQTDAGTDKIKFYNNGSLSGEVFANFNTVTNYTTTYVASYNTSGTLDQSQLLLCAYGNTADGLITVTPDLIGLYATAIKLGAGTAILDTDGLVYSNSYTPTLTNVQNIATATAFTTYFTRVGKNVSVFGEINIGATAAGLCELDLSLPIASNFTNQSQCAGMGANFNDNVICRIDAETTNNRARMLFVAAGTSIRTHTFNFSYVII